MIKTTEDFERQGCDNCKHYLHFQGNRDLMIECTSSSFTGMIGMMTPDQSWVAKWQRIDKFTPGMYAISVNGRLPQSILNELKGKCIYLRDRDTSLRMKD
ncbi:Oidioi.mRNA.OKI2018_I69.XSR.g14934.t1.cds [Oikopleura dioica]|nr:Oidioi.mRNA.OKI2018_I69.XSR.g14934.t1.cds [Oikopleura dioica]